MPTVKNVKGSSANSKPNAGKQYAQITGKPVPEGMQITHDSRGSRKKATSCSSCSSKEPSHKHRALQGKAQTSSYKQVIATQCFLPTYSKCVNPL